MEDDEFMLAASFAKTIIGTLKTSQVLQLYGLYKQATLGDNTEPKPSWFNLTDKQKWEAWTAQKGKDGERAKEEYVRFVTAEDPDWRDKVEDSKDQKHQSWVFHSSLLNEDQPLTEEEKTVFDWVKENDLQRLTEALRQGMALDVKDPEGLTPLHWAADRGHLAVVDLLLSSKVAVDSRDQDGQTPLHYAASCGHVDVVRSLIQHGADVSLHDADGCLPKDVTSSPEIETLLAC